MKFINHNGAICLSITILLLFLSGCEQRYWYRTKVNSAQGKSTNQPKRTVQIEIRNYSPEFISKNFERTIKDVGMLELTKQGFLKSSNDTPAFKLVIHLKVDSYYVYSANTRLKQTPTPRIISKTPIEINASNSLKAKNMVKELAFNYQLTSKSSGKTVWQFDDGLYFFNVERRDLKRSIGMVMYNLSYVP